MLSLAKFKPVSLHAGKDTGKTGTVARLAENSAFFVVAPPTALNVKMDSTCLWVLEATARVAQRDARRVLLLHVHIVSITIGLRVGTVLV
jgi:hypothetical protein